MSKFFYYLGLITALGLSYLFYVYLYTIVVFIALGCGLGVYTFIRRIV